MTSKRAIDPAFKAKPVDMTGISMDLELVSLDQVIHMGLPIYARFRAHRCHDPAESTVK